MWQRSVFTYCYLRFSSAEVSSGRNTHSVAELMRTGGGKGLTLNWRNDGRTDAWGSLKRRTEGE